MKLLLAFPEWRTLAEPVVHARATHESERREAEDGAGAHLVFFVTVVCRRTARRASKALESKCSVGERTAKRILFC